MWLRYLDTTLAELRKFYINNCWKSIEHWEYDMPTKALTSFSHKYSLELDITPEIDTDDTRLCQAWVQILLWAVELGRLNIHLEVSLISSHVANHRRWYLKEILHIFADLKKRNKLTIAFNPRHPSIDEEISIDCNWKDFYPDAQKAIPNNLPKPRGKDVSITCFVDAFHTNNLKTWRPNTGILIYINCAPIIWYSKRYNTVESRTFGSEFTALKTVIEILIRLRFKLRCFEIPIDGSSNAMYDNKAVTKKCPHSSIHTTEEA